MRGRIVCFIAPATFLTSLGLIDAALTRTTAVFSSAVGLGASVNSRTDGSPNALNTIARMALLLRMAACFEDDDRSPRMRRKSGERRAASHARGIVDVDLPISADLDQVSVGVAEIDRGHFSARAYPLNRAECEVDAVVPKARRDLVEGAAGHQAKVRRPGSGAHGLRLERMVGLMDVDLL